jgi:hypothetical protein
LLATGIDGGVFSDDFLSLWVVVGLDGLDDAEVLSDPQGEGVVLQLEFVEVAVVVDGRLLNDGCQRLFGL